MDEKLEQMEDRLSALYANASYEVNEQFAKYAKTFEKEDKQRYAEMQEGVISKEEYSLWRQRHILQTDLYKATVDKITGTLVNTDVVAMALVNGELPSVVSQSYNFVQSLGWKEADESGLSVGTFQIYNADAVQAILKDNPDLLPVVDVPEDKKWNKEKINDTIASSIIKGDPIDKVAENLQKVANMDHNSAVRNARTAMTGAENLGRTQSASDLKAKGIPMDEVWSATYDDRVRASHLMLDGTKRDENGVFGADFLSTPLRYPADPNGDPEEIYNCRCRLNVVLAGIDHSQDDDLYEQFMKENYTESWQKMQENEGYKEKERQKEDALARKERLLEQKAEAQAKEEAEQKEKSSLTSSDNVVYTTGNESKEDTTMNNTYGNEEWRKEQPRYQEKTLGGVYFYDSPKSFGEAIEKKYYDKLPQYAQKSVMWIDGSKTMDGLHMSMYYVNAEGRVTYLDEYGYKDFMWLVKNAKDDMGNMNDFIYDGDFRDGEILERKKKNG